MIKSKKKKNVNLAAIKNANPSKDEKGKEKPFTIFSSTKNFSAYFRHPKAVYNREGHHHNGRS